MIRTVLAASLLAGTALPTLAQSVAAPAEVIPASADADKAFEAQHADWTEILQTYIVTDADGLNRFDYGALKASASDSAKLDAYIERLAKQDWETLSREEQFVAWANLYNAVTIRHIIGRYPVKSIRSGYLSGPWKETGVEINGRGFVSLDDMEHGILRANWDEPRIHYMVNCASIGCPNLRDTAWEASPSLDEELDAAARAYVNSERGVQIRRDGRLKVSRIYKWFREDFGDSEQGVIDHLLQYADADLAEKINARPDIRSYVYDWNLNDTVR